MPRRVNVAGTLMAAIIIIGFSASVARAQQAMPVIGFLGVETPNVFADRVRAFRQGLGEMGYVEGRNVAIMFQWAGGNYGLLPTMAEEFVRQRVSVVVAGGTTTTALAVKAATATIPIVFFTGGDQLSCDVRPRRTRAHSRGSHRRRPTRRVPRSR